MASSGILWIDLLLTFVRLLFAVGHYLGIIIGGQCMAVLHHRAH